MYINITFYTASDVEAEGIRALIGDASEREDATVHTEPWYEPTRYDLHAGNQSPSAYFYVVCPSLSPISLLNKCL